MEVYNGVELFKDVSLLFVLMLVFVKCVMQDA